MEVNDAGSHGSEIIRIEQKTGGAIEMRQRLRSDAKCLMLTGSATPERAGHGMRNEMALICDAHAEFPTCAGIRTFRAVAERRDRTKKNSGIACAENSDTSTVF